MESARIQRFLHLEGSMVRLIEELLSSSHVPGLAIGVLCAGEVVHAQGYGCNKLKGSKVTKSSIFPIGSLTKAFSAAACGMLVSEGLLNWDTPLCEYLTDYLPVHAPSANLKTTIIDVLCHSTGLEDPQSLYIGAEGVLLFETRKGMMQILNHLDRGPNDFRTVWRYNGLMYGLVSVLIEELTHSTFRDYFKQKICVPLGMMNTDLLGTLSPDNNNLSYPHIISNDGNAHQVELVSYGVSSHFSTSCGMQSTIEDLLKWSKCVIENYNHSHQGFSIEETSTLFAPISSLSNISSQSISYCPGWFHTTGQPAFENVFEHILDRTHDGTCATNLDCQRDSKTYPQEERSSGMNTSDCIRRECLFHSGLVSGSTSSIHIFPSSRDAIVVLANATGNGDIVDWVARAIYQILAGDILEFDSLKKGFAEQAIEHQERWRAMHQEWSLGRASEDPDIDTMRRITGQFLNDDFGLRISIFMELVGNEKFQTIDCTKPREHLRICFHHHTTYSYRLSHYRANIYSFFPSSDEYQLRSRNHISDFEQCLVYLHYIEGTKELFPIGLWWQFDIKKPGIWFSRT